MMTCGLRAARVIGAALILIGSVTGCTGDGGGESVRVSGDEALRDHGQGLGDRYYPDDGNRGYDVKHYLVALDYFVPKQTISARATITSVATSALKRFHLDLLGLKVTSVSVDGRPATFARTDAHELVIAPRKRVGNGKRFVTRVTYTGKPGSNPDPGEPSAWYDSSNPGGGFIAGEPHSCTIWYPCNDHPTDKATFELLATVPRPFEVVSIGAELPVTSGIRPGGERVRTYHWKLEEKTATYLTTMYIDELTLERSTLDDGTPVVSAYGPDPGTAPAREAKLPEILEVLAEYWGPYPAPQAGGIFVNGDVPFSLETFTRPIYTEGADIETIVHENGHQWWGDNVSIKRWRDICLNECLASYSQWLWREHLGQNLDSLYQQGVSGPPSWFDAPLYDMGAGQEFDFDGVYLKGTYFVHALRNKIGDDEFFAAMREIQGEHAGGNISMLDLRDILQDKTDVDLSSFWDEWVHEVGVPSDDNLFPGDLAD